MNELQALLLGLVQGLTEYLPVSSSGHLEIGKMLLGVDAEAGGLTFDIVVHVATVLATLVILWKEVVWILQGLFKCVSEDERKSKSIQAHSIGHFRYKLRLEWNDETRYVVAILVSMIPVGFVGFCLKDSIEALYADEHVRTLVVGSCLIVTAALLTLTHFFQPKTEKENISTLHAFIIGIAQAVAVLPGLSRSGSTIATGLLLGNSKQKLAQFSFLMVIPPILGEMLLDFKHIVAPSAEYIAEHGANAVIPTSSLIVGFLAAFVSGCFACKWMISLVKKCKLIYFGIYCFVAGMLVLILG